MGTTYLVVEDENHTVNVELLTIILLSQGGRDIRLYGRRTDWHEHVHPVSRRGRKQTSKMSPRP